MKETTDDVSKIHNKYSLTLLSPSSPYSSLIISIIVVSGLVITTYFAFFDYNEIIFRLPLVVTALALTQLIDTRYIRNKEYSKSLHASLFVIVWLVIILIGLAANIIFPKENGLFFVSLGMILFASFRIGIFTTVLGAKIGKAWAVCFIQPLAIFFALVPQNLWQDTLLDPHVLIFGGIFLALATAWSLLTDRAGRPSVQSTHKLIQAYLSSQGRDHTEIEAMMEERAKTEKIFTSQLRLQSSKGNTDFRIVLPEIHPGPYHPTGGSNIPYLIYKNFGESAMIFHSISDHTLNLPSKIQVEEYLKGLRNSFVKKQGLECTEPVTVQINKARVIGLLFEKNALLFLSLSPHGMEDLPTYIKTEIESYAKNRNFEKVMITDCHNAMGKEISSEDGEDMLKAAKSCLDTLITKQSYPLQFGYANSSDMKLTTTDLGLGGLGVVCFMINDSKYFLGWADSNNMENGVRERIVNDFTTHGYNLLEICTSDTHYTPVKVRNKNGYNQFGLVTNPENISEWYLILARKAEQNMSPGSFEILENETSVKVMGLQIFEDYSRALDKSLRVTKIFLAGGIITFITSLFV